MAKREKVDELRREIMKKAVWGIPTLLMVMNLMAIKAQATTPTDPSDPGEIGAPRIGRRKKKKDRTRLRPLFENERDALNKDVWNRGRKIWGDSSEDQ